MKKTTWFSIMLTAALTVGLNAQAADPYGKYDKPVTITIGAKIDATGKFPAGDGPENNIYTRRLAESFNIVVKNAWQASEADYPRKVTLSIAADDLPDAMVVNEAQLRQMVKAGQLQDLSEAFAKYAAPQLRSAWNKSKATAERAVTFNGKMLAIPSITVPDDGYTLLWIRQDWLDKLGLKAPKSVAELEAVANAFVEKDPGNLGKGKVIGIGGPQTGGQLYGDFLVNSTNNAFSFDPIFSAYGSTPGYWVKGKDGKAVYGSIQPETKVALAKLADLFKKKLIDRQIGIRKDATEAIVAGQVGMFFGPWWMGYWPFPDAVKQNPNANWQAYAAPLDSEGKWTPHTGSSHKTFVVVRKGYEHPEAVIKMLNCLDRDQATFDTASTRIENFPLRIVITMSDELAVSRQASLDVQSGRKKIEDYTTPEYRPYSMIVQDIKNLLDVKKAPFDKLDIQYWNTTDAAWPRTYSIIVGDRPVAEAGRPLGTQLPFYASTKTIEARWTSLKKLEDETFINIILGGKPIAAFDEFVTKWKAQGGDTVTAEVNEALN